MIKKLLAEWLEERRLGRRPPLPQDATIYIMAFVEWAESKAAQGGLGSQSSFITDESSSSKVSGKSPRR